MDDDQMIEVLTKAREYFREHGGAKGEYEVDGKVCALGAIYAVSGRDLDEVIDRALTPTCMRLHDMNVATLNDGSDDPMPVILDLYDATIKDFENGR